MCQVDSSRLSLCLGPRLSWVWGFTMNQAVSRSRWSCQHSSKECFNNYSWPLIVSEDSYLLNQKTALFYLSIIWAESRLLSLVQFRQKPANSYRIHTA